MVTFTTKSLILEIPCEAETTADTYYGLLQALSEIVWFALDNDADDLIRKESAYIAYNLLKPLLQTDREARNRLTFCSTAGGEIVSSQ